MEETVTNTAADAGVENSTPAPVVNEAPPAPEKPWFEQARDQLTDLRASGTTRTLEEELQHTLELARQHNVKWVITIFEELPSIVTAVIEFPKTLYRACVRGVFVITRTIIRFISKS